LRILYIEDEPADAQLVERYIEVTTHEIVVVSSIPDARSALDNPVDLILVDVLLNKSRSGYDFVRELRTQGLTQPIIAITGLAFEADIQRCYTVGCNEVLTKPYAIKQLAELLDKYSS
jgi:two-component system, sensor histidine kinase